MVMRSAVQTVSCIHAVSPRYVAHATYTEIFGDPRSYEIVIHTTQGVTQPGKKVLDVILEACPRVTVLAQRK